MRILDFNDGFTSENEPSLGTVVTTSLKTFADDAEYVTYKGSPASQGNIYQRTSDNSVRFYNGTDWVSISAQDVAGNVVTPGNLTVQGNLTVMGTTTTVNSEDLSVKDKNITVNKDGNDASADGSGLTVKRTTVDGSIVYDSTKPSKWKVGNVGSEKEVLTDSDTQTISNKNISSLTNTITTQPNGNLAATELNAALAELQTDVDTRAKPSDIATHSGQTTGVHGVSTTVAGTGDAQVFTNKDYDGGTASNTNRLTIPKNTKANLESLTRKAGTVFFDETSGKPYYDDGTNLKVIGSGSGGSINFISNGDGSTGTTGWVEGSFTAGARPSGTFTPGSSTGFSLSATSTNPLGVSGTSLVLSKGSGNLQGKAQVFEFDLPLGYRAKVLSIRSKYVVNSGTFVAGSKTTDSDLIWYTQEFDGSTWTTLEPSSFKLWSNSSTVADDMPQGEIQPKSTTTKMRLIAFVSSTSTAAWSIKLDVSVSPSNYVYGTPISDWKVATGLTSNWTNVSLSGLERRVGGNVEYQVLVAINGTPTGPGFGINIPYTIDSTRTVTAPGGNLQQSVGHAVMTRPGSSAFHLNADYMNTSGIALYFMANNGTPSSGSTTSLNQNVTPTLPFALASGDRIVATFSVPIQGWSSSVQMSDSFDSRQIGARAGFSSATGSVPSTSTPAAFNLIPFDDVSGFSGLGTTSFKYTIQSSGEYQLSGALAANSTTAGTHACSILVNGTAVSTGVQAVLGATSNGVSVIPQVLVKVLAGDVITLNEQAVSGTWTRAGAINANFISISKLPGTQVIASTELVAVRAATNSGLAIPLSTFVKVPFPIREFDTHGLLQANQTDFVVPVQGIYRVNACFQTNAVTLGAGASATVAIFKNGVVWSQPGSVIGNGSSNYIYLQGNDLVKCNAGDIIDIRVYSNAATNLAVSASTNFVNIKLEK